MAAVRRSLAFTSLLALLFLLGLAFQVEVPWEEVGSPPCQCSEYTYEGLPCENRTCRTVECYFIDTVEEVDCVADFLTNVSANAPDFPLNVALMDSDFDVFPDDFLTSYNVLALVLNSNTMTEVPYSLINPVCPGLLELTVFYGVIQAVNASGFQNCTMLLKLDLSTNGIAEISPEAFVGLDTLQELVLFDNVLHTFVGFEGIGGLQILDLSLNKISSVAKDAFQGLGLLGHVDLSRNNLSTLEEGTFDPLDQSQVDMNLEENPLNCNCSLKWLQQWTIDNNADKTATCNSPENIPVVNADFTNCPSAARLNRKSTIEVLASGSVIIFVLMYFTFTEL